MGYGMITHSPKIQVRGLNKVFARPDGSAHQVLSDIQLDIHEGEIVCLLGPSGCGKTTLLSAIAGFDTPSAGQVHIDGQTVTRPDPRRMVIFQEYGLFPWLTVQDNVLFGLKAQGVPANEAKERSAHYLRLVGLSAYGQTHPHQLSGGMKQRVAIARALAVRPDVLLMDEPFGALDAFTRYRLQDELLRLLERGGLTVVLVTHDIDEAIYLGDRVVLMAPDPGRIQESLAIDQPRPRQRTGIAFESYRRRVFQAFALVHERMTDYAI